jgi:Holliday junction resolvase-like predicted endonuclease
MSTDRRSLASKSICNKAIDRAKKHYIKKGYRLLRESYRSPFAEIDLVFQRGKLETLLVEVKGLRSIEFFERTVQSGQIHRLHRALIWMQERHKGSVKLEYFVLINGTEEAFFELSDLLS